MSQSPWEGTALVGCRLFEVLVLVGLAIIANYHTLWLCLSECCLALLTLHSCWISSELSLVVGFLAGRVPSPLPLVVGSLVITSKCSLTITLV